MRVPIPLKAKLITNQKFIRWIKNPTLKDEVFWSWWQARYPHYSEIFDEARELVLLMEFKPVLPSHQQIGEMKRGYKRKIHGRWRRRLLSAAWKGAAVLFTGWFVYLLLQTDPSDVHTIVTQKGQKLSVILPDESTVWLNGGSTLQYNTTSFGSGEQRMVQLDGEGFFEVTTDTAKPFIVKTKDLNVKVLGTSFNVRSYPDDQIVETVLVEGKVSIHSHESEHERELVPNQVAVYEKSSDQLTVRSIDADKSVSWKTGVLIIENETFAEMSRKLERWYGMEVEVVSGADCRVSVKIEGETLKEIMEALKLTSRVRYRMEKDKVSIEVTCN